MCIAALVGAGRGSKVLDKISVVESRNRGQVKGRLTTNNTVTRATVNHNKTQQASVFHRSGLRYGSREKVRPISRRLDHRTARALPPATVNPTLGAIIHFRLPADWLTAAAALHTNQSHALQKPMTDMSKWSGCAAFGGGSCAAAPLPQNLPHRALSFPTALSHLLFLKFYHLEWNSTRR